MTTWSNSRIETAGCPMRYDLKYNKGLKEPSAPPLDFGSAAHEFFYEYGRRCQAEGLPGDIGTLEEALKTVIDKQTHILTADQIHDLREVGLRWAKNTAIPPESRFELRIAVTREGEILPDWWDKRAWCRGVIDRLDVLPQRRDGPSVKVTDYKTNWALPPSEDRAQREQLLLYAWMALQAFSELPEVEVVLDFVRHGVQRSKIVKREEANEAADRLERRAAEVDAMTIFPPKAGRNCGICGFHDRCPLASGKGPANAVATREQAENAAQQVVALEARARDLWYKLRAFVEGAGPVRAGDIEFAFHTIHSVKYAKPLEVQEIVTAAGGPLVLNVDGRKIAGAARDPELAKKLEPFQYDASYSRFEGKVIGEEKQHEQADMA